MGTLITLQFFALIEQYKTRILTSEIDVGFGFETERNSNGKLVLKITHIPAEIDIENMVKNICDLGYAAEEQYRRNSELMRRMLEAKEGVVTGP